MLVKVYLNDGKDHFYGFHNQFANNPELTMVHSFEMSEWPGVPPKMDSVLSYVYESLNVDDPAAKWAKEYRAKYLRSLSVGDVVAIGEAAWSVEPIGFKRITTEELQNAIIWNDETESVR